MLAFQFTPSTALCSGFLDSSPLPSFSSHDRAALGQSQRDFLPMPLTQKLRAGTCQQRQLLPAVDLSEVLLCGPWLLSSNHLNFQVSPITQHCLAMPT